MCGRLCLLEFTRKAEMTALASTGSFLPPLFDVGDLWARLWRGRWRVSACVVAALSLALLYLAVTTPTYTATASLLVDPRDARSTQFETVLPGIGADSAAVASQVFVIESRDLLMRVFESQRIAQDPEFADPGILSFLTGAGGRERDAIFRRFEKRVSVERAGLTYVIKVGFKSRSAQKAAMIANAIVARYTAGLAGERENANDDVNARLKGRLSALQRNVAEAERAVAEFKVRHELLDPAAGGTLQSQIDQLTTQVIDARAKADAARGRYEQAVAAERAQPGAARLSEIVSSVALDGLRADYNQRAATMANADTVYQPHHPTVRRLRSELSRTKALMAAEAGRITRELKAKQDLADEAVEVLETKLIEMRAKSQAADAARVELRRLEAKADAARTVLDDVLKRTEETAQMRGLQLSEARVIGVASPPVQPSWPTPTLVLPVSVAIGFLAGCGLAVTGGSPRSGRAEAKLLDVTPRGSLAGSQVVPVHLGRYELPGVAGMSMPARMRAMRRRLLHPSGAVFSRSTLQLVRRIVARLEEHPAPYMLLVSSVDSPLEAQLTGAMIGLGLQQAGQKVLIVDFVKHGRSGSVMAGVSVNGASGLPTIVRPLAPGTNGRAFTLEAHLADGFDFILLLAPPIGIDGWDAAYFRSVDLMLFTFTPADAGACMRDQLRRALRDSDMQRSATLIVAIDDEPCDNPAIKERSDAEG